MTSKFSKKEFVITNQCINLFEFSTVYFQGSIEEANQRLVFYCTYDNTLDKIQTEAVTALERDHPLDYIENEALNYNSMFDEQLKAGYMASTPNSEHAVVSVNNEISGAKRFFHAPYLPIFLRSIILVLPSSNYDKKRNGKISGVQ